MECLGICRSLEVQIGSYSLISDFYVVEVSAVDVVMGAQWLRTLGEFKMNINELYIRFKENGKEVKL